MAMGGLQTRLRLWCLVKSRSPRAAWLVCFPHSQFGFPSFLRAGIEEVKAEKRLKAGDERKEPCSGGQGDHADAVRLKAAAGGENPTREEGSSVG